MKREEWTLGLVLVALLVSLVVVPLVAPLAGAEARAGLVFAGEGDEDDDDDDDDGKIAIYWVGGNIYNDPVDPDDIAQKVLDRGFTHVVNSPFLLDLNRDEWFDARGFKVLQDITAVKFDLDVTPRFSSPYEKPGAYADKLAKLEAHLLSCADYLVGIDDDMELYPWPTKTYKADGTEEIYPKK